MFTWQEIVQLSDDGSEERSLLGVVVHAVGHEFGQLRAVWSDQLTLGFVKSLLLLRRVKEKKAFESGSGRRKKRCGSLWSTLLACVLYLCEFLLFEGNFSVVADLPQGCTEPPFVCCHTQRRDALHAFGSDPRDTMDTLYREQVIFQVTHFYQKSSIDSTPPPLPTTNISTAV